MKKYCPYVSGIDGVALGFSVEMTEEQQAHYNAVLSGKIKCNCGSLTCINIIRSSEFKDYLEYYKLKYINEETIMGFMLWKSLGMKLK